MIQTIKIITLGCSKNLVDSEQLLYQLDKSIFAIIPEDSEIFPDIALINTCGFIQDAKQESIDTIMEYIQAKDAGKVQKIYVFGCLSERYKQELIKEMPEIDGFFGVYEMPEILQKLNDKYNLQDIHKRSITTPAHYAYLKVAEGCDRTCSFCAIPLFKGKFKSKPKEVLLQEANYLAEQGVKEILLIAQDLSYYGLDIYKTPSIADLSNEIAKIKGIEWVRLHYLYPHKFPESLIRQIKDNPKICNYLDIPFQHISDNILKLMKRGNTKKQTYDLIAKLRQEIPDIALRTTLLVGHPGETDNDFEELMDFVEDIKFEKLGVFTYSHEEDTYAFQHYKDEIPQNVKQDRADKIMEIQEKISFSINQKKIGKIYKVLIDRKEGDYYIGRTEFDSPEVDGEVLINTRNLKIGNFYPIRITEATEFDVIGKLIEKK